MRLTMLGRVTSLAFGLYNGCKTYYMVAGTNLMLKAKGMFDD